MRSAFVIVVVVVVACGGTTQPDDAGADASLKDATKDVTPLDVSVTDADDAGDGAFVCAPNLPSGYTPTWIPPSAPSAACTTQQIQTLYDDCVGPNQSSSACSAFLGVQANATCEACMETPIQSPTYGPTIEWHSGASLDVNIGGCMALVDGDKSANGCGAKYEAWESCEIAACSYCPEGTYESCAVPVESGACSAYESAAKQCYADSQYAVCKQTTFESYFTTYGAMFCAAD